MRSTSQALREGRAGAVAVALALASAALLSGCSSHAVIDNLPAAVGGLPEGVPERPATPPSYPAVHNMPPARPDTALTAAETKKLREDLITTRERAAKEAADATAADAVAESSTPPASAARNP